MLITFSAIDGAGKSTQISLLKQAMEARGQRVQVLWSRGGYTPTFEALKRWSRRLAAGRLPSAGHSPKREKYLKSGWVQTVWLTIAILDMMFVYGVQIRWWRMRGLQVLCDRYLWDTLIDYKIAFPRANVETWALWRTLVFVTPTPDLEFAMELSFADSVNRCKQKYDPFPDSDAIRSLRHQLYQELFRHPRWCRIDGRLPVERVAVEMQAAVTAAAGELSEQVGV